MATLSQIGNFWQVRAGYQYERWLGACLVAAYAIINEDPATSNHANRIAWANVMLGDDEAAVAAQVRAHVKYAIASNATLQGDPEGIDDSGIQFIVNSQIDTFATG